MSNPRPVPGWYRDPARRYEHRYWNGTVWTTHVMFAGLRAIDADQRAPEPARSAETQAEEPAPEQPTFAAPVMEDLLEVVDAAPPVAEEPADEAAPTALPGWPFAVWALVLLGAALLVVGATLPWAEAQNATSSFTQDGIETDGAITIVVAVLVVLAFIVVQRPKVAAALVIGGALVAGAIGAGYAVDTSSKAADLVDHGPPGISAGVGVGVPLTLAAATILLIGGIAAFVVASRAAPA